MPIIYREPLEEEEIIIKSNLAYWLNNQNLEMFLQKNCLLIGEGKWREVVFTNKETKELLMRKAEINPYSVGLGLGEIKGAELHLGLSGAIELAKKSNKKVIINANAEQLFLYQRNIHCKSIVELPQSLKVANKVFVLNERKECLGIGQMLLTPKVIKKKENQNKEAVRNLKDLGWYLRKGK